MYVIEGEKFLELMDRLETEGWICSCDYGYRFPKPVFNALRDNPSKIKEEIRTNYYEYYSDDNENRIEYTKEKEPQKLASLPKSLPLHFSGNLAVDIITVMSRKLMGDRFIKGIHIPSWLNLEDVKNDLLKGWVFLG